MNPVVDHKIKPGMYISKSEFLAIVHELCCIWCWDWPGAAVLASEEEEEDEEEEEADWFSSLLRDALYDGPDWLCPYL